MFYISQYVVVITFYVSWNKNKNKKNSGSRHFVTSSLSLLRDLQTQAYARLNTGNERKPHLWGHLTKGQHYLNLITETLTFVMSTAQDMISASLLIG